MIKDWFVKAISFFLCGFYFFYKRHYIRGLIVSFFVFLSLFLVLLSFRLQGLLSYALLFLAVLLFSSLFIYNFLTLMFGLPVRQMKIERDKDCDSQLKLIMVCFLKKDYQLMYQKSFHLWKFNKRDPEVLYQYAKSLYFLGRTRQARFLFKRYFLLNDDRWLTYIQKMLKQC